MSGREGRRPPGGASDGAGKHGEVPVAELARATPSSNSQDGPGGSMQPRRYQVVPDLRDADFDALKADIAERGVMVPVEYDDDGNILDGHHRVRAAQELGISNWPKLLRSELTEAEKRAHARQLNLARRHLTQEQKQALIAEQLRETPEQSNRQVASGLGVDHKTVATARVSLVKTGEIPQLDKTVGKDGKARPVRLTRGAEKREEQERQAADQREAADIIVSALDPAAVDRLIALLGNTTIARYLIEARGQPEAREEAAADAQGEAAASNISSAAEGPKRGEQGDFVDVAPEVIVFQPARAPARPPPPKRTRGPTLQPRLPIKCPRMQRPPTAADGA